MSVGSPGNFETNFTNQHGAFISRSTKKKDTILYLSGIDEYIRHHFHGVLVRESYLGSKIAFHIIVLSDNLE